MGHLATVQGRQLEVVHGLGEGSSRGVLGPNTVGGTEHGGDSAPLGGVAKLEGGKDHVGGSEACRRH